jgi:hypothetical protein
MWPRGSADNNLAGGLLWLVVAVWLIIVFFLPFFEAPDQSRLSAYATNSDFRAIIMRGDNLRYYMRRDEFEKIPYPDRAAAMKEISTPWCKEADKAFLPSVYLYDIKTGERLDSYNCAWGAARDQATRKSK